MHRDDSNMSAFSLVDDTEEYSNDSHTTNTNNTTESSSGSGLANKNTSNSDKNTVAKAAPGGDPLAATTQVVKVDMKPESKPAANAAVESKESTQEDRDKPCVAPKEEKPSVPEQQEATAAAVKAGGSDKETKAHETEGKSQTHGSFAQTGQAAHKQDGAVQQEQPAAKQDALPVLEATGKERSSNEAVAVADTQEQIADGAKTENVEGKPKLGLVTSVDDNNTKTPVKKVEAAASPAEEPKGKVDDDFDNLPSFLCESPMGKDAKSGADADAASDVDLEDFEKMIAELGE